MRHGRFLLAVTVGFLLGVAGTGLAATAGDLRQVVTGDTAEVEGENDSVQVTAAVVTESPDLAKAADQNNQRSTAVVDALKALKLENLKLRTTEYRVVIQRNHAAGHSGEITGYQVSNAVEAVLEGVGKQALAVEVPKLIAAALQAGANEVRQVNFYIQDRDALEQQALALATHGAAAKAASLAKAAGVKLGRLVLLSSQPQNAVPVLPANALRAAAAADAPALEPGESRVAASVVVAYEVE